MEPLPTPTLRNTASTAVHFPDPSDVQVISTREEQQANEFLLKNGIPLGTGRFAKKPAAGIEGTPAKTVTNLFGLKPIGDKSTYSYHQYEMRIFGKSQKMDKNGELLEVKEFELNKKLAGDGFTKKLPDYFRIQKLLRFIKIWTVVENGLHAINAVDPFCAVFDFDRVVMTKTAFVNLQPIDAKTFRLDLDSTIVGETFIGVTELWATFELLCTPKVFGETEDYASRERAGVLYMELLTKMRVTMDPGFAAMYESGKGYFMYPADAGFTNDSIPELPEGKYLGIGFQEKIRPCVSGDNSNGFALSLDTKKTPFIGCMPMDKLYQLYLAPDARGRTQTFSGANATKILNNFKNLTCHLTHRTNNPVIIVTAVSTQFTARNKRFVGSDGKEQSVMEYFQDRYNIILNAPDIPLIEYKSRGKDGLPQINYMPMEVCHITDYQRLGKNAQTPEITGILVKQCAVLPKVRREQIKRIYEALDFGNDKYINAAGFEMDSEMKTINGRKLAAPALTYAMKKETPDSQTRKWKLSGTFLRPANLSNWGCYYFESYNNKAKLNENELWEFITKYTNQMKQRGMTVADCYELRKSEPSQEALTKLFDELKDCNAQFALFISPEGVTGCHEILKFLELQTGVITQDLKMETAHRVMFKNQMITLDNILMKTNLKLGGINFSIETKSGAKNLFEEGRMILGVSFNSTDPNIHNEMNNNLLTIGYSSNCGQFTSEFIGDYLTIDRAKVSPVSAWVTILQRSLELYREVDDRGNPKEVIIYRSSGSEGQYINYSLYDCAVIKKTLGDIDPAIKFSLIIVEKAHNVRIFKHVINGTEATEQNVIPGTVVDTNIVNPLLFEFYMTSHLALKGCAKIPRYIVIEDNIKLQNDAIQMLTNSLCYCYQIVNSPVSIPAPLYIAEQYVNRGKNNINCCYALGKSHDADFGNLALYLQEHSLKTRRVNA